MIKFEETEVWGFKHAFRGMRNPMNSWDQSDSWFPSNKIDEIDEFDCEKYLYNKPCSEGDYNDDCPSSNSPYIGPKDLDLAQRLIKAGSEHRKFLRQIFVSVDITASLYFWKEFDTYKVGTVANSCSTMHKIHAREFTMNDFSCERLSSLSKLCFNNTIDILNDYRNLYVNWDECTDEEKDYWLEGVRGDGEPYTRKDAWYQLIQLLPSSYNQKRTVTLNYENIYTTIRQRRNHKLNEWSGKDTPEMENFIAWAKTLPYAEELLFYDLENTKAKEESKTSKAVATNISATESPTEKTKYDSVNSPSHYASGGIECIDAMVAAYGVEAVKDFCKCNAFKYQWRFDKKNGDEDVRKAQWYQNKLMELEKNAG